MAPVAASAHAWILSCWPDVFRSWVRPSCDSSSLGVRPGDRGSPTTAEAGRGLAYRADWLSRARVGEHPPGRGRPECRRAGGLPDRNRRRIPCGRLPRFPAASPGRPEKSRARRTVAATAPRLVLQGTGRFGRPDEFVRRSAPARASQSWTCREPIMVTGSASKRDPRRAERAMQHGSCAAMLRRREPGPHRLRATTQSPASERDPRRAERAMQQRSHKRPPLRPLIFV